MAFSIRRVFDKLYTQALDTILYHLLPYVKNLDFRKTALTYFDPTKVKKILLVSTAGIGDTAFNTAAFRAVRRRYPAAEIVALFYDWNYGLFKDNPYIDGAYPIHRRYKGFFRSVVALRKDHFDVGVVLHAIDYQGVTRLYLAGIPFIIGGMWYNTKFRFLLSNRRECEGYDRRLYRYIETRMHLVELIGCDKSDMRMNHRVSAGAAEEVLKVFQDHGVGSNELLVGFQLRTSDVRKDWPPYRFAELGKMLLSHYGNMNILLLGGEGDKDAGREVCDRIEDSRVIDLTGLLELPVVAGIIDKLALLVSGDTGIFHLAIALKTPTIALFGHGYYKHINAIYDKEIHLSISKSDSGGLGAVQNRSSAKCMDMISAECVMDKIIALLPVTSE